MLCARHMFALTAFSLQEVVAPTHSILGLFVLVVIAASMLSIAVLLRHRLGFWIFWLLLVTINLLVMFSPIVGGERWEHFLGMMYFPQDWFATKLGWTGRSLASIFLSILVFPFWGAVILEALTVLLEPLVKNHHNFRLHARVR